MLVLTDHNEFKVLDYDMLERNMNHVRIFDTKDVVTNLERSKEYINFGNLHEFIRFEKVLI